MMREIKALFHYISDSFMLKMMISYSLIIILMLAALTIVVSHNYADDLKLDEINYENQIIKRVADYSDSNIESARNILNQIYLSTNDMKKVVLLGGCFLGYN